MTFSKTINLKTKGFCDIINVTDEVEKIISESKAQSGLVCVFVKGSTCGVTTIEYEPNLVEDFKELMEKLVPEKLSTRHGDTWGDDNGFSHLRASLIGPSICIPINNGKMLLGTWQQIVICDFDNRSREREVIIEVVS